MFTRALFRRPPLRIALCGPSGSGKTRGALALASGLGKRIAVIDTERCGAALYADEFAFDVLRLAPPYGPERFVRCVRAAAEQGYDVLVLDSFSRPWSGPGGVLESVARNRREQVPLPWEEPGAQHATLLEALQSSPCHVVATMRARTVWRPCERGAQNARTMNAGLQPEQRSDIGYEFMLLLHLMQGKPMRVAKDATGVLQGMNEGRDLPRAPDATLGQRLLAWQKGYGGNGCFAVNGTAPAGNRNHGPRPGAGCQ
jgi:hypothetical protein